MSPPVTAGILIIGNEILSGKVEDLNSPYLCKELRFLGVEVLRIVTVPDEIDVIAEQARKLSELCTWVFTSGGVGPTHDDVTIDGVAASHGAVIVFSTRMEELIRSYYGAQTNEAHLRMARIPEGSELLDTPPLKSPQLLFHNIFVFPGVPELLRQRFSALKERFRTEPIHLGQFFLNVEEGQVAATLDATISKFSGLMLGSYPALWNKDYSLKLTLESRDPNELREAMAFLTKRLPESSILRTE